MCLFSPYCPYNEKSKVGRWVSEKCIFFWGGGAKYKHGDLFLTGIDIRFDNVIAFIDFSNCLPLIDTAIIGKVN